jgi:putative nucleotidyltransferase with HDIG domain
MIVLTVLSFIQVSRQLQAESRRELLEAAKSLGWGVFERLTILNSDLEVASLRIQHSDPIPSATHESHFETITVSKDQIHAGLSDPFLIITTSERAHLFSGKPLIRFGSCSTKKSFECIDMVRMIDRHNPASGLISGEVNSDYLWSTDKIPAYIEFCVFAPRNRIVYSPDGGETSVADLPPERNSSGFFQWRIHETVYDAAYRDLFLRAGFLTDTWTIVVSQNHHDALAPMRRFRNTFLLVALLAVWIVVLLSLIQIRRTMGPLEKLREGTRQIADQNFDARVDIASGDEFEDLAASFNAMSVRLGRQFHTLRTISDIDQAILSSLSRDVVISTTLSRLPNLLPGQCFAIAIFQQNSSDAASVQITVRKLKPDSQRTFDGRVASAAELEQLRHNRSIHFPLVAVQTPEFLLPLKELGMTSVSGFPILLDHKPFGALLCGQAGTTLMTSEDTHLASQVADQLAVAFSNVQLIEALEQLHWGTLTALARTIDAKSAWTAGHSERVTQVALKIGSAMDLSPRELQVMHRGGLLHDIGKIGTAPEILDKPGKLDSQEMQHMQDHVRLGVRILEPIAAFTEALPIVAQHHEWFNGGGYPAGLAGEEISLHARIFAVADCYDAMVSDRPYRKGMPKKEVIEMLRKKSGIQFDPNVIDVFVRLCGEGGTIGNAGDAFLLVEQST